MSFTESTDSRLHGLDALRGLALTLGVVLHGAMAYLTVPVWPTGDVASEPVANALFFAIHLFRMTAFFIIAGLFAQMMLDRRGVGGFLKNRLIRIGGPLAVFWGPALAAIIAVVVWNAALQNGGAVPDGPPPPAPTLQTLPLTHLWFLWVLLILCAGLTVVHVPLRMLAKGADWMVGAQTPFLLAAPLAVALWLHPDWMPFFAVPTPDYGLVPNAAALTAYGVAFLFGAVLWRRRDLLGRLGEFWPVYAGLGLGAGTAAFMATGGLDPELTPIVEPASKAALAALISVAVFTTALAAVAAAQRFLSGYSAWRRYLSDASYWVYIVHLPLVMAAQVLVADAPWAWWIKLGVVVAGVMAVSLLTYAVLIRHTFMGRWLNGRRVPLRRRRDAAVAE